MRLSTLPVLLSMCVALPAVAESFVALGGGTAAVANAGKIELRDRSNELIGLWKGPSEPVGLARSADGSIIATATRDGNVYTVRSRELTITSTGLSITGLLYADDLLWVLDGYTGDLIRGDGETFEQVARLGPDSALMRHGSGSIYVAARGSAELVRLDSTTGVILARVPIPAQVADMELDGEAIYLALPQRGEILVLGAEDLEKREQFRLGSAPVDLARGSRGTALTAGLIWVADPVLGAVIGEERSQSMSAAVSRGFLRGVLGIGTARADVRKLPGRPSRVVRSGAGVVAQELTTGVLWRIEGNRVVELGRAAAGAFAADEASDLVAWLDLTSSELQWSRTP